MQRFRCVVRAATLVSAALAVACGDAPPAPRVAPPLPEGATAQPSLEAHTAEFEERVYTVTDGVYQAVGFGLANSILVEGDECVFIVDTLASLERARAVRAEFEKLTPKPIRAVVYTHNHADHVFGARGFVDEDREDEIDVYAHETLSYYVDRLVNVLRPVIGRRSERMFGNHLPREGPDRMVNAGIGPFLEAGHGGGTPTLVRPTVTFADRLETEICGVEVVLQHAPGETNDQLFVWLPERRVLMPGDNVYKAFPNLYTIRGTLHRDLLDWVASLDAMRALRPAHLAPSHTRPLSGEAPVMDVLTAYRDAIQFVHDQTVRGMNRGLTPDELVLEVRLPPHLANHPWLQEFYGTVEWSVRSVFAGYLGWFDGDTATLSPASPDERASGMVELAGGPEALLEVTERALAEGRFAWAAELASHLLRFDPDLARARAAKAAALRAMGQQSVSPNGRNFYLTQARELEGATTVGELLADESALGVARAMPIGNYVAAMPANLDPAKSATADRVMVFHFRDPDRGVDEAYTLHVRRGVAELRTGAAPNPEILLVARPDAWIDVVLGLRGLPAAMASGDIEVEGGLARVPAVLSFLAMFR